MADLKKSLASIREPAVAVYLCDWRFEDDFLVDALAADLSDRKIVLSVVGTEAAFSRAWTDGSVDPFDRSRITNGSPYYPGIGRSPFGKPDPEAPWHGGDSAYPPMPYHFLEMFWQTEFQKASKSAIDLGGLLGKKPDPDRPPEPPGEPAGMDDPPSDAPEPPEDLGDEGDRGRG